MSEPSSHSVGVIGLGLIGGSLALALRGSGFAGRVLGLDIDASVARRAVDFGVIDEAEESIDALVERSDVVMIAAPTLAAAAILEQLFTALETAASPCWITDVASVKGPLCRLAADRPDAVRRRFVPGHPIAGSERSGVGAARADLFDLHRVVLTPTGFSDPEGEQLVRRLWESTGALVVQLGIEEHDRVLAATSHLPHAVAFALVHALAKSDESTEVFRFAAGGFRDFTRIASSDPIMWRDISLANAGELIAAIDLFSEHLADLRALVATADADGLQRMFWDAKRARDEFAAELQARQKRKAP